MSSNFWEVVLYKASRIPEYGEDSGPESSLTSSGIVIKGSLYCFEAEHLFECEANYPIKRVQRKLCDPADKSPFAYRNCCGALTACPLSEQSHTGPDPPAPPEWLWDRNTAPRLNIHTPCNVRKQNTRDKLDTEPLQALACTLHRSTVEIQGISAQTNPAWTHSAGILHAALLPADRALPWQLPVMKYIKSPEQTAGLLWRGKKK